MLHLERFAFTPMGVFGRLIFNGFECYTCENPWKDNKPRISCIPQGTYTANLYSSPTPGRGIVWQLNDVPGRSNIQIHRGNTEDDVLGCIVVGKGLGFVQSKHGKEQKWAVTKSRIAFQELMEATEMFDEISITIDHYEPEGSHYKGDF